MDKRLAFALGVTTIFGSVESVYALTQRDTTAEIRKVQIKPKPTRSVKAQRRAPLKLSVRFKDDKIKGSGATRPFSQSGLTNKKLSRY